MQEAETGLVDLKTETDETPGGSPKTTVYYNGACPLCSAEIGHYRSREGGDRLCFVDVSRADADLGSGLGQDAAMRRFHVRLTDGTLVSGARGFVAVWDTLPRWSGAARFARLPGVMRLLEGAYRVFLPIRPALSRLAAWFGAKPANQARTRP